MTPVYRQDKLAATERATTLQREVSAKRRLLTDFIIEHLPEELQANLSAFAGLPPDEDPFQRAEDLTRELEVLEQALALLPGLRQELLVLPIEGQLPRPDNAGMPMFREGDLALDREHLTRVLRTIDPAATTWLDGSWDHGAVVAALRPEGSPVGMILSRLRRELVKDNNTHQEREVIRTVREGQAWTRLAAGTPRLEVYPQSLVETWLLKPLRMRRDVTLGDKDLDRRFMFDAEEDVARTLLSERVRQGMRILDDRANDVRLHVEANAVATVTWDEELSEPLACAVVDVLVGLRSVSIEPLLDARGLASGRFP